MIRYAVPLLVLGALAAPATAAEVQIQAQAPVVELTVTDTVNAKPDVARLGALIGRDLGHWLADCGNPGG